MTDDGWPMADDGWLMAHDRERERGTTRIMLPGLLKFLSLSGVWVGGLGLAACLALFWVLRGAPIGQEVRPEDDQDAPRGGYRDRVVAAVCLGMLLILLGGTLAVTRGIPWSLLPFALGFGTVL